MKQRMCPICEAGQLHTQTEWIDVEHLGQQGRIESHFAECDACGSEQAGATEARLNKRAMIAFKKQVQGLLTGKQVRDLRKAWGLSQEEAAKVFGGGPVAFSKYESDDVMQSDAMDKLLRMADEVPIALERLMAKAGVQPKHTIRWDNVAVVNFTKQKTKLRTVIRTSHSIENEASYGG
ncbi:type II toxin-antitoxin system MqsA family antitoxin [Marinomonas flavescens]|uniref:type II toxin-antitoxin system MqsA family antitoxin n=1 Tax=Marinomonas flavescens TaxID=2529379 RepID=UPI0010560A4A|nr:type II toxin-antitoxin system MqsA family antitoxin [Marinomonas flavescens]